MPNGNPKPVVAISDLDQVLHIVVQVAQRRVGHLMSWGFGPEHPEVQASRVIFEMQQHVFNVHVHAQRQKRRHNEAHDS